MSATDDDPQSASPERDAHSMTGSGRASGTTPSGALTVELRSVNGRNLGIKTRMAPELQPFEPWIDARLRARLDRGSVLVLADLEPIDDAREDVEKAVDRERFAAAATLLTDLAREHGLTAGPSVADVLSCLGVLRSSGSRPAGEGRSRTSREPDEVFRGVFDRALDALIETRRVEGAATVASMLGEVAVLAEARAAACARLPAVREGFRTRLLERVNEFLRDRAPALEPADVLREVSVFAEKTDVGEEVQRLGAHLERLRERLAGGGPVGRGLDFLLQEVLREVNTLGSKTPDAEVAERVVEMKAAVDRLKEQAANLE